jgi:hypothetical protein
MPNFTKIGPALNVLDDINLGAGELGKNNFKQG